MDTLDPQIKAKWLEALRSGKYEQGEGRLNKDNQFCCLGVLCDLIKDDIGFTWRDDDIIFGVKRFSPIHETEFSSYSSSAVFIPQTLDFSFLNTRKLIINNTPGTLSCHNDLFNATFAEIADAIEEQL